MALNLHIVSLELFFYLKYVVFLISEVNYLNLGVLWYIL